MIFKCVTTNNHLFTGEKLCGDQRKPCQNSGNHRQEDGWEL
jgi:hypothetical protein